MSFMFLMSSSNGEASGSMSGGLTDFVTRLFFKDLIAGDAKKEYILKLQLEFFIRKAAHLTEYLILGGLFISFLLQFRIRYILAGLIAFAAAVLFAFSDEFHQSFVEGRVGLIFDVLVDAAGALIGIFVLMAIIAVVRLSKKEAVKKR